MAAIHEVYLPDARTVELGPFADRVLSLVSLFEDTPVARLHIVGTIAAGEPIEAFESPEDIAVRGPHATVQRHPHIAALRRYLCPSLERISADAFEVARVITPLLVGLKLSGRVDIDLDPWLFAGIALLVERVGVAGFCAGATYAAEEEAGVAHAREAVQSTVHWAAEPSGRRDGDGPLHRQERRRHARRSRHQHRPGG